MTAVDAPPTGPGAFLEAEAAVLGAALLSPAAAGRALELLDPGDFDRGAHRVVFEGIAELHGRREPADTVTLMDWLARAGRLDEVGGPVALHDLTVSTPTPANVVHYARRVREAARWRRDRAAYAGAVARLDAGEDPAEVRASLPDDPPDATGLEPVDWPSAWAGTGSDVAWLVPGLLQAGRYAALVGAAKVGKSLLALEIAAALATGRQALGRQVGAVGVCYLDHENALDDVLSRLAALGYGPADDLARLAYLTMPPMPPLDTDAGGAALAAAARAAAAELVVIDTLSRTIAGDENDSRTVLDLHRHTIVPLRRDGIAVLAVDHLGKDATRGARGSSAKADAADVVWQVTARGSQLLELRATHRRQLGYPEHLMLHRRGDPLRHVEADRGTHVEDDVVTLAHRLDDLGLAPDASRSTCRAALRDAGQTASTELLAAAIRHRKGLSADPTPNHAPADNPQPALTDTTDRPGQ